MTVDTIQKVILGVDDVNRSGNRARTGKRRIARLRAAFLIPIMFVTMFACAALVRLVEKTESHVIEGNVEFVLNTQGCDISIEACDSNCTAPSGGWISFRRVRTLTKTIIVKNLEQTALVALSVLSPHDCSVAGDGSCFHRCFITLKMPNVGGRLRITQSEDGATSGSSHPRLIVQDGVALSSLYISGTSLDIQFKRATIDTLTTISGSGGSRLARRLLKRRPFFIHEMTLTSR